MYPNTRNKEHKPSKDISENYCPFQDNFVKTEIKHKFHHLTRIACTIGPSSTDPKILEEFTIKGMDMARINMSHGQRFDYIQIINRLHTIWNKLSQTTENFYPRAIAIDLCGPEIRTGILQNDQGNSEIELEYDKTIAITTNTEFSRMCNKDIIYINYNILNVIKINHHIHINNSEIILKVIEISYDTLICKIIRGGILKSKQHVRLSEVSIELNALSEKDKNDLKFAVDHNIDYVFASLINGPKDIALIRNCLKNFSKSDKKRIKIITKIQTLSAINNIDELITVSDGIHFPRDSLYAVIPVEHIFTVQKCIMEKCLKAGKPISYTANLKSMTTSSSPLIAEIFDISNAILNGACSLIINIETSIGRYPVETLSWVVKTCKAIERQENILKTNEEVLKNSVEKIKESKSNTDASTICAVSAIKVHSQCNATATFVISNNSKLLNLISNLRPCNLIFPIVRHEKDARRSCILRGVWPLIYQKSSEEYIYKEIENQLNFAIMSVKKLGFIQNDDPVVIAINIDKNELIQIVRLIYVCEKYELDLQRANFNLENN